MRRIFRLAPFAGYRIGSQFLALLTGIVIVRLLPIDQYAYYALAISILSAIAHVASSGMTSTLMSRVAELRRPSPELDSEYSSALRARVISTVGTTLIAATLLTSLLLANDADVGTTVLVVIVTVCCVPPALSFGMNSVELQLQRRFSAMGLVDLVTNGVKLGLAVLAMALNTATAAAVATITLVATVIQAAATNRALRATLQMRWSAASRISSQIYLHSLAKTVPATLAMIVGEQVVNVILTANGNTDGIAQIAALSRYALAFTVINSIVATIGASTIARAPARSRELLQGSAKYVGLYAALCTATVAALTLASPFLLFLLGPDYEELSVEFFVLVVGAAITNFASFGIGVITHARGWISFSWSYIPFAVIWLVVVPQNVSTATSLGAATLAASLSIPLLLSQVVRLVVGVRQRLHE